MIFTENNKEYYLEVSPLLSPEELQKGLWLVMAGVDDIPPHIALIQDGKYYSVSAKKVEVAAPLQNFLKAISRKTVPTLFVNIKSPIKVLPNGEDLEGAFSYPPLGSGPHSCLWPIRDFFAQSFSEKYSKAEFVFELLAMAEKDGLIKECKSLFTPSVGSPQGRNLEESELHSPLGGNKKGVEQVILPKYTSAQIRERINSILKVNE